VQLNDAALPRRDGACSAKPPARGKAGHKSKNGANIVQITITITDQEIQESVHRALTANGRRLSVIDWVIRDLTDRVPFYAGCRQSLWAKQENFRPLIEAEVKARLCEGAFDAGLTEKERTDISGGRAILSGDGGKYHAVYL
jgi:hypothetical protein